MVYIEQASSAHFKGSTQQGHDDLTRQSRLYVGKSDHYMEVFHALEMM